ncbi:MAG TPA: tripartite tricarboxylate transporter substrate binding protein [Burkholderiales bacterium]|nr:tripartite tricarboxylate transporter substrate binding protein [Burkholderiales bacterium]
MGNLLRNSLAVLLAIALGIQMPSSALAQSYPTRPVRLIIPFPPGGSNDIVGRMIAAQLGDRLGQQIVPDNRGGAGGTIGTELAAKAPADGYTLLLISTAYAFNTSIYKKLPYDPVSSFVPVALLGSGPGVLVINPGLPVNSVAELVAFAKERPGKLNNASAGVGSFQHLASELFRIQAGIQWLHVPYKGGGPAMMDLIAGQADVSVGSLIQMLPHIRSGKLKALGTTGAKRSPVLPDVPTVAEAGVPGYEATNWWGLLAPAGTPQTIVDRVHQEVGAVQASAETKKRFESEGAEARGMSPAEFGAFIAAETTKWAQVVKEAGITAE